MCSTRNLFGDRRSWGFPVVSKCTRGSVGGWFAKIDFPERRPVKGARMSEPGTTAAAVVAAKIGWSACAKRAAPSGGSPLIQSRPSPALNRIYRQSSGTRLFRPISLSTGIAKSVGLRGVGPALVLTLPGSFLAQIEEASPSFDAATDNVT